MPHGNATACVTTDQSRSGERSIRWEFPLDEGANCFLEANHPYGNDVWIEFWIYPSREGAYRSSTDEVGVGKLIYAYTSATGPSIWCLQQSVDRYGTLTCDNNDFGSNEIGNEGMGLCYTGPGAATRVSGYNLQPKLMHWNTWNHVILNTRHDGPNDSYQALWLDNGDGTGLEPVMQHDLTGECAWDAGGSQPTGTTCGRLKFGLMNTQDPGYYYLDDIRVATSSGDLDWTGTGDRFSFQRGDANDDGSVDIGDALFTLVYLFELELEPDCLDAVDVDNSEIINLSDVIYTLNYLFTGGPSPPSPGPAICGEDPAGESLGCESYTSCP
jgi:hypothetical protein